MNMSRSWSRLGGTLPDRPVQETRYSCPDCQDLGILYVLRKGRNGQRWYAATAPCIQCEKGRDKHGPRTEPCRWARFVGERCVICGAFPGQATPAEWDGTPVALGRILTRMECLHLNDGTAEDPVVKYTKAE